MNNRLPDFHSEAREAHERLGRNGALQILEMGHAWSSRWDLPTILRAGGAVLFPHIGLERCGPHTAAAVHACIDSGAERVLVVGVLHALTQELEDARVRVAQGADVTREAAWGIQGPGLDGRTDWQAEFSLLDFLFLWSVEIERRQARAPELIVRYPYLAGGRPEILAGIAELREIACSAVVVATADPFHHGIGYGDSVETALAPERGGLDLARRRIEEGLALLSAGEYWAYNQHCVSAKSDARDVGQVVRYLLGPLAGRILDLTWADTAEAYVKPAPTWVAGALIELTAEPRGEK
jgi:hypothetical protein